MVALAVGGIDVVVAVSSSFVGTEIECLGVVMVERCDFVVGCVDGCSEVGGSGVLLSVEDGVPDVKATESAGSVGGEIENGGSVVKVSDGGMGVGGTFEIDGAGEALGVFPVAVLPLHGVDIAGELFGIGGAVGEVEDVVLFVVGDVVGVFCHAVHSPIAGCSRCRTAVGFELGLVDLLEDGVNGEEGSELLRVLD